MISIRYFHPIGKKLYRTRSKSIESDRNRSTLIVVDRNIRGSPSDAYPFEKDVSFDSVHDVVSVILAVYFTIAIDRISLWGAHSIKAVLTAGVKLFRNFPPLPSS